MFYRCPFLIVFASFSARLQIIDHVTHFVGPLALQFRAIKRPYPYYTEMGIGIEDHSVYWKKSVSDNQSEMYMSQGNCTIATIGDSKNIDYDKNDLITFGSSHLINGILTEMLVRNCSIQSPKDIKNWAVMSSRYHQNAKSCIYAVALDTFT